MGRQVDLTVPVKINQQRSPFHYNDILYSNVVGVVPMKVFFLRGAAAIPKCHTGRELQAKRHRKIIKKKSNFCGSVNTLSLL